MITQVGSTVVNGNLDADLTALGATDWVIYNGFGSGGIQDRKLGGSAIGVLTSAGGEANAGALGAGMRFDYTNGTTATGTQVDVNGGFGRRISNPGGSPDGTLSLSITLAAGDSTANVFFSNNNRVTNSFLSASITGSPSANTANVGGGNYNNYFYQFKVDVVGATAGEVLNIDYVGQDGGDFNSRIILNAVTLSAVPEPSSIVLLSLGVLTLAARRRR